MLIRPNQAESTKGKNIIIDDKRPEKKLTQKENLQAAAKTSMLGGQGKKMKAGNKTTGMSDDAPIGLTSASSELESSSKSKTRPSIKELLAKYEKQ